MASLPEPILQLTAALGKLPGIGPRSAERLALHLVQTDREEVRRLAEVILTAKEKILHCTRCGILTETPLCGICTDSRRDESLVCVVERPTDILSLEKSGTFKGKYHVLGGKISPLNGVEPEDLRIAELEKRLESEPIREVIVALATDVEGDATSMYLARRMAKPGVRITRIAHGLPAGSSMENADELTLTHALSGRREM